MSENNNSQVMLLAGLFKQATDTLHGTMSDVTSDAAHYLPAGNANTIAANAAHIITGIDGIIHGLIMGGTPLMATEPTGLSTPAPMGGDWGDWGRTVQIEKATLKAYAEKVIKSAADYINTLNDTDLTRNVTSPSGTEMSVGRWLGIAILNTAWHTGEIASLKGTQGLTGYPF